MTEDLGTAKASPDEPRARLLAAAVACIEEHGVSAVTSRLIAARAGVNAAAVNYYFGSKDQLIARALELTRREGFVEPLLDFDRLLEQGATRAAALRSVVREMLANSLNYPKIAFAHLQDAIENQRYDGASVRQLNEFLRQLDHRLGALASPEAHRARRARLAQIWAAVGLNAMASGLFQEFTELDLRLDPHLDLYVDELLAGLSVE